MNPARWPHAPYPRAPYSQNLCGDGRVLDRRTFLAGTSAVLLAAPLAAETFSGACQAICG